MERETHYSGIQKALESKNKLRAFCSGGGLRVVRIEGPKGLVGYGEHFSIDEALVHADEDFLAGHRNYQDVYGKIYPAYLTGSSHPSCELDDWMLKGFKFNASFYKVRGSIRFDLQGIVHQDIPRSVLDMAKGNPNERVLYEDRGFVYETVYNLRMYANGEGGWSTSAIKTDRVANKDPWMYTVKKTGYGKILEEAIKNALLAEGEEVSDDGI